MLATLFRHQLPGKILYLARIVPIMWRGDEEEERLSNELEAHYDEWGLAGVGESTVWIQQGSTPHPDLVGWCAKYGFDIKGWPETEH